MATKKNETPEVQETVATAAISEDAVTEPVQDAAEVLAEGVGEQQTTDAAEPADELAAEGPKEEEASRPAARRSARSSAVDGEAEKARNNRTLKNQIGGFYTQALGTATMPEEERARELSTIRAAIRNKTVLFATVNRVNAVSPDGVVTIDALYGRSTWVRFVAEDFFAETPRFANIVKEENREKRAERWRQAGGRYLKANIGFIPMEIIRDAETDENIVMASRSLAMRQMREATFFPRRNPPQVGDYGQANIVDCRPNRIVVEFCGVEVKMNNGELVAFQYLPDATEDKRFHNGNTLYVAITAMNLDPVTKHVDLALSHAMIELTSTDVKPIPKSIIGSTQLGTIIAVRKTAYIAVFNGMRCRCIINKNDNRSFEALGIGDTVSVQVRSIASETMHMVRGACWKTT